MPPRTIVKYALILMLPLAIFILPSNMIGASSKETKETIHTGTRAQNGEDQGTERKNRLSDKFLPFNDNDKRARYFNMSLTREYQMKLPLRDLHLENRKAGITNFLSRLSILFDLPFLSKIENGNETIRYQYTMDTKYCGGHNYAPRIRNYYSGFRANTTTLDVKSGTSGETGPEKILKKAWDPAPEYKNGGHLQKFEWDIHPCKIKYSVESRIHVPFEPEYTTCNDIANLFPRVKNQVPPEDMNKPISVKPLFSDWWYELEHHGLLADNITEYKTAITLRYPSRETAMAGATLPTGVGEWSIRIWSSGHGQRNWVREAVIDMNNLYFEILNYFETLDFPCPKEYDMAALDFGPVR